jgi:tripartite-type tricarboxylate transporter receptor subunit TctC
LSALPQRQPILIDVKAGAAGTLAPAQLMNAEPDGHALAVARSIHRHSVIGQRWPELCTGHSR